MDRLCRIFLICFVLAVGGIFLQSSQRDRDIGIQQIEEKAECVENMKKTGKQLLMVKTDNVDERGKSIKETFKIRQKHLNKVCHEYKDIKHSKRFTPMRMSSQRKTEKNRRQKLDHPRQINHRQARKHPILTMKDYYVSNDSRLTQKPVLTSHLLDNDRKILYCWNHKVASSFWMWMFTKIETGKEPPAGKPTYTIQYRMSPQTVSKFRKAVSTYDSILLVRHPFIRLISAYRDRVEGLKASSWLYHKITKTLHLHRKDRKINKRGKVVFVPSWSEFVRYLLATKTAEDVSSLYLKW